MNSKFQRQLLTYRFVNGFAIAFTFSNLISLVVETFYPGSAVWDILFFASLFSMIVWFVVIPYQTIGHQSLRKPQLIFKSLSLVAFSLFVLVGKYLV